MQHINMADLENLLLEAAGISGASERKQKSAPSSKRRRREGSYSEDGSDSRDDDRGYASMNYGSSVRWGSRQQRAKMNPLTLVKRIQNMNSKEALGIYDEASWHAKYEGSAYVYAGSLPFDLTEGDLLAVFAQCGEIVDINLVRDKRTGKSKGFAFIAYEDQRGTTLAVDNLNGAQILGRVVKVDHVSNYKKKEEEDEEERQRKREARGVCRAFQRGDCTRGAGCKFSHDEQRAANTGWGAEDSKWGHSDFDGPKRKESRFGDDFKDGVRNDDKRSRALDKKSEDQTKARKQVSRREEGDFRPKSRDRDRGRDERSPSRHEDVDLRVKSRGEAYRQEDKRSRRHMDDDFRLKAEEEFERKSKDKAYRGEERRLNKHADDENDLKHIGKECGREESRSKRTEDNELQHIGNENPEERREKRRRYESKPKDDEDRSFRDRRPPHREADEHRRK